MTAFCIVSRKRRLAPIICLLTLSCSGSAPEPRSLCDVPRNLAGWEGATVRWKGILIGTREHGYGLMAEECRRRGINLGLPADERVRDELGALFSTFETRPAGSLRVDLSGKIVGERLIVQTIYSKQPIADHKP